MGRSVGIDRDKVVAAAGQLADARQLEQLTLAQVAEQLGVKLPSLYNHISGLAGLRRELALYGLRQLATEFAIASIGRSGDEAIIALTNAYRSYIHAHPGVYAATIHKPDDDDHEHHQLATTIISILRAVMEPYGLSEEQNIHAIRALRSVVHGFCTLELNSGFGIKLDLDESFRLLIQGYIVGLRSMQEKNSPPA